MAAPMVTEFDPMRDLAGRWTTDLAEKYLPRPGRPYDKYECVDGRLILSPMERFDNALATMMLGEIMGPAARAAGMWLAAQVNLTFANNRWIIPDAIVVSGPPPMGKQRLWVPPDKAVMPIEMVSRSSRDRDYIDKP